MAIAGCVSVQHMLHGASVSYTGASDLPSPCCQQVVVVDMIACSLFQSAFTDCRVRDLVKRFGTSGFSSVLLL